MDKRKTIFIGSDHAGFELKVEIIEYLKESKYKVKDLGNKIYEKEDDYPDYAYKLANKVIEDNSIGILFGGSGIGACIVANKVKGIRAANPSNIDMAEISKKNNDTNVLCLGQNYIGPELAKEIVSVWINTDFSQDNSKKRRVEKIQMLEHEIK